MSALRCYAGEELGYGKTDMGTRGEICISALSVSSSSLVDLILSFLYCNTLGNREVFVARGFSHLILNIPFERSLSAGSVQQDNLYILTPFRDFFKLKCNRQK